jgi:catechol 2,3-dioxygenase-like lactoylglutathione lyase family enzyme
MLSANNNQVNIRFLTVHVNDLDATRNFYTDILGMTEAGYYNAEEMGYIGYKTDSLEMQFWRWDKGELPINEKWDWQPGMFEGEGSQVSWSVLIPEDDYKNVVDKILNSKLKTKTSKPIWNEQSAYWMFIIKDPAGYTVEVYMTPSQLPKKAENGEIIWE